MDCTNSHANRTDCSTKWNFSFNRENGSTCKGKLKIDGVCSPLCQQYCRVEREHPDKICCGKKHKYFLNHLKKNHLKHNNLNL